ncbi:hypothetical protein [Niastella yeongjuensis]|nr:hypothetical protein [Niastella yeongjuensis]SEN39833.1 hypothetical protein SAMN05660816_00896 [Niastella yeongjuensis]
MKTNYKLVNMYLNSRRHNAKSYFMLAVLFAITVIIGVTVG